MEILDVHTSAIRGYHEWCAREDFYTLLPHLLRGEDPDFTSYIQKLADQERGRKVPTA